MFRARRIFGFKGQFFISASQYPRGSVLRYHKMIYGQKYTKTWSKMLFFADIISFVMLQCTSVVTL